jgi:hypothetical protein
MHRFDREWADPKKEKEERERETEAEAETNS